MEIISKKIKKMTLDEKYELACSLRKSLIESVSKTGGHIASNLGIVELTIAIHSVFNLPKDKVIFDVGHQCYIHKMLTGRQDEMSTLRQFNGISGFPKTNESEYDAFNTGHSSTSISVASGIARARDLSKKNFNVVALIGDGSLTGGMALEALNDVGSSNLNMTVILNDNGMSISKSTGGISQMLSNIRTRKGYVNLNSKVRKAIDKIPLIGKGLVNGVRVIKNQIKRLFISNMYFEDIGYTYLGPVDGHDIKKLESLLEKSKQIKGPVLVHVITKKGKGYLPAEENPDMFHGISKFDIETGLPIDKKAKDYSKCFGDKLVSMAEKNKKIVAITAAMTDGTGLKEFSEKYKDRFFDVGIAEQHALGLASGLAKEGYIPFVPIYSSFLQRGYDQLIHDICMQKLHVVICVDRAGIVGNDGETHQGLFDLTYLSSIPNMTVMAPKDFNEFEAMMEFAEKFDGPIAIRYPRGTSEYSFDKCDKILLGKCEVLKKGKDLTIISIGKMVAKSTEVSDMLTDYTTTVVNARFIKPIDKEIINIIKDSKLVVTIEDNLKDGGLYTHILELMNENGIEKKVIPFAYDDKFVKHGSVKELERDNGLDSKSIVNKIKKKIR